MDFVFSVTRLCEIFKFCSKRLKLLGVRRETFNKLQSKLLKQLREFDSYIRNNQDYIPSYGERYRNGERIATGFVESTVNQVVSKRMAKTQQMAWTERGAHLLLQVRTRMLNGGLEETFRHWYPKFRCQEPVVLVSQPLAP